MKGIAEEAGPSESAAFVSWVFRERLLRIPSLELCGVSNPTVGHLRWRPFYSPWRCVKPLCRAIFALTVCFDGDSSSPAWNVAGRKMARCQQMWQSLAESLDGAETLPADIKERCRKCLFQAAFQHLLLCSQGDWTTAYKANDAGAAEWFNYSNDGKVLRKQVDITYCKKPASTTMGSGTLQNGSSGRYVYHLQHYLNRYLASRG